MAHGVRGFSQSLTGSKAEMAWQIKLFNQRQPESSGRKENSISLQVVPPGSLLFLPVIPPVVRNLLMSLPVSLATPNNASETPL